jgi:hypothetical protein
MTLTSVVQEKVRTRASGVRPTCCQRRPMRRTKRTSQKRRKKKKRMSQKMFKRRN